MKILSLNIDPIEYTEPGKHSWYVGIGKNAPWDNFQLPVPRFIFKLICKKGK